MPETALGSALSKVGFVPRQMRLVVALDEFIRAGGTEEELIAAYRARKELRGGGQEAHSSNGRHQGSAQTAQPQTGGNGPILDVSATADPLPPAGPSSSQLAAVTRAKERSAQSVFDRELTAWGKQWGNVFYRDLDGMTEDGDIALAAKKHIGALRGNERHKQIRELMTAREFAQLINRVRKHAA